MIYKKNIIHHKPWQTESLILARIRITGIMSWFAYKGSVFAFNGPQKQTRIETLNKTNVN